MPLPPSAPLGKHALQDQMLVRIAGRVSKLGGWVVSVATMTLTWSDETSAIHDEQPGFSPTLEGALAYYAPECREQSRRAFEACVTAGTPFDLELPLVTAKSRKIWARVIGEAVRNEAGMVTHVQGACQDISERRLAEEQIQTLADRLQETIETLSDAFLILDRDWNFTYLNHEAERLLVRTRTQLLGRNIWQEFPQAVGTESDREYHRAMVDRVTVRFEQFYPPLDRWLGVEAHPTRDGIAVSFRDITERRISEQTSLSQMEGRFLGLLDAAPDAMAVVNQHGKIVLINLRAERAFGYLSDELIGRQISELIPEGFPERLIAIGARATEERVVQSLECALELSARRKDGSEFPIELMVSPALRTSEGILVTASIRDITVRQAAVRHLALLESRQRGLLEAAPDAMVLLNQEGAIVLVNRQAELQFGYQREDLVGQQLRVVIPDVPSMIPDLKRRILDALRTSNQAIAPEIVAEDGFSPEVKRHIADALRSAGAAVAPQIGSVVELTGRRKDGGTFPVEIALSILQDPEHILITVAIRDITKRKQVHERLLLTMADLSRSNEELSQFAYLASHDLQEPLRMVASYTQLLSKRYKGRLDADADDFIAFAVDGANRMQRLIQDLLAYSRIGTASPKRHKTDSEESLRLATLNLRGAVEASAAIITHDPLPTVLADSGQLVQLFQNLLGNAIRYQGSGIPRIHVSCTQEDARAPWVFSVRDNGLGIEAQYFEKIFGMFQRLHRREEYEGTGIGLAICRKIVERHGGTIDVESKLGLGSTFRFTLSPDAAESLSQPRGTSDDVITLAQISG